MKRRTDGGYQGPVTIMTKDGSPLARAACRYRADLDAFGVDRWQGFLHRIIPAGAMQQGDYRLQFPSGEEGEIAVIEPSALLDEATFIGRGQRPLNRL